MADSKAVKEENRRIRQLQRMVDLALFLIRAGPLDRSRAEALAVQVRAKALQLFPDKETTYDLIYQPRFNRALHERFGLH